MGPVVRIFVGHTWEPFSPRTMDASGCGGSEMAVIEMARNFALLGCETYVYGDFDADFDGVRYRPHTTWNPGLESHLHIAWRFATSLLQRPRARTTVLWMHDLRIGALAPDVYAHIDRVAVISRFQHDLVAAEHPALKPKLWLTKNGIVPQRYAPGVARVAHRYLYSSSPTRGLAVLVDAWPAVRERLPDAELHVCYGFDLIIKLHRSLYGPHVAQKMVDLQARLEGVQGIFNHGRIGIDALAKLQQSCEAWLYPPDDFTETFCITAIEAQAAGCVPVTRVNGALPEVLNHHIVWREPGDLLRLLCDEVPRFTDAQRFQNQVWAMSHSWQITAVRWAVDLFGFGGPPSRSTPSAGS